MNWDSTNTGLPGQITSMAKAVDDVQDSIDNLDMSGLRSMTKSIVEDLQKHTKLNDIIFKQDNRAAELQKILMSRQRNFNLAEEKEYEAILKNAQTLLDIEEQQLNRKKDLTQQQSLLRQGAEKIKQLADDTRIIMSDPKLAGGIALGFIAKHVSEIATDVNSIRKDFGLTGGQTLKMAGNLTGAAAQGALLGLSFEETAEASKAILGHNKNLSHSTATNMKNVAYMADRYGISAEEAAHLTQLTQQLSGYNKKNAESLTKSYAAIAGQYNITRGAVMKDMADNAEYVALYTNATGLNVAKSAGAMNSFGLSLSTAAKMSESLLNIESSIGAEQEASVFMQGQGLKALNLNRARQLMYQGDAAAAQEDILKQMPTMAKWSSIDMITRKKIAASVGLEANELMTMIGERENLNRLDKDHMGTWDNVVMAITGGVKMLKEYGGLMGGILNFSASLLTNWKGVEKIGSGVTSMLSSGWGKMKGVFGGGGKVAEAAGAAKENITGKMTDTISEKVTDKASGGASKMTESFKSAGKNMTNIMKGAAAFAIMSVGLIGIATALKIAEGVSWDTVVNMGAALLGLTAATAAIGAIMMIPGATQGIILGATAFAILGASLIPVAYALNLMAPGMSVLQGLADPAIFTGLFDASAAIASLAGSMTLLSASLLLMVPMLPVLAAVTALSSVGISTGNITGGKKEATSNKDVIEKLDEIKSLLSNGMTINIDGRKIGKALDLIGSQQNSLNPVNK